MCVCLGAYGKVRREMSLSEQNQEDWKGTKSDLQNLCLPSFSPPCCGKPPALTHHHPGRDGKLSRGPHHHRQRRQDVTCPGVGEGRGGQKGNTFWRVSTAQVKAVPQLEKRPGPAHACSWDLEQVQPQSGPQWADDLPVHSFQSSRLLNSGPKQGQGILDLSSQGELCSANWPVGL